MDNFETHDIPTSEFLARFYDQEAHRLPPFPDYQQRREEFQELARRYRLNPSAALVTVGKIDMNSESLWC